MKSGILVQARMGSARLPGKVLKKVLGRPVLALELERLKRIQRVDQVIVATTVCSKDDAIVQLCENLQVPIFRGDENDVLSRYYKAAKMYELDVIIRITADCPLIDPKVIEKGMEVFFQKPNAYDYISNCNPRTYPKGMDVEIFSSEALKMAYSLAIASDEREHVTLYLYQQPGRCRIGNFEHNRDLSSYRLTLDTLEDFEQIRSIYQALYPKNKNFTLEDIVALMER